MHLEEPTVAQVSLIDDLNPGTFIFQEPNYHMSLTSKTSASVVARIVRLQGSDGKIRIKYRTINGTAHGGDIDDLRKNSCDFIIVENGVLDFASGESSKNITIKLNPLSERGKTFIVVLTEASGSACLGHRCATIVSMTTEVDEIVNQVTAMTESHSRTFMGEWKEQFQEAMSLDTEDCSSAAMLSHFVSFFWKVLFACIPPR